MAHKVSFHPSSSLCFAASKHGVVLACSSSRLQRALCQRTIELAQQRLGLFPWHTKSLSFHPSSSLCFAASKHGVVLACSSSRLQRALCQRTIELRCV
ncbi:hypothetical protein GQ54DRAFT_225782 [Martensiomyces pterosporus]|nr:hypothetical protein GQ54DRAFT_225782 [Martensiomyces pterosporus]